MSQILPKGIQDLLPAKPPAPPLPRGLMKVVGKGGKGAVLYYDFERRSLLPPPFRSYVLDKSGHWNIGVLKNDAHIENGRLKLDGEDDCVETWKPVDLTNSFTISGRVYIIGQPNPYPTLVANAPSGGASDGFKLMVKVGQIEIETGDGGTKEVLSSDKYGFSIRNDWAHFTWVYDNGESRFYLNGGSIGSDTSTISFNKGAGLEIGCMTNEYGNSFWNGKIDELRIYNRALSKKEIS